MVCVAYIFFFFSAYFFIYFDEFIKEEVYRTVLINSCQLLLFFRKWRMAVKGGRSKRVCKTCVFALIWFVFLLLYQNANAPSKQNHCCIVCKFGIFLMQPWYLTVGEQHFVWFSPIVSLPFPTNVFPLFFSFLSFTFASFALIDIRLRKWHNFNF